MVGYHITPYHTYQTKIKRHGLIPRIGARSKNIGEPIERIYLFGSLNACEDALMNWLGDEYEDMGVEFVAILEIDLDGIDVERDPYVPWEYWVFDPIPPDKIKLIGQEVLAEGFICEDVGMLMEQFKKDIAKIDTVDALMNYINGLDKQPQRGFSWKPQSAKRLSSSDMLIHFCRNEDVAKAILSNGFRGIGAWYSSLTKTNVGQKESSEGNFAFAWDAAGKKMNSRYTKNISGYGKWGICFTSGSAIKTYNTCDKESQVIFDVNDANPFCVVLRELDPINRDEWIYSIFDLGLNLIEEGTKFENVLKYFKRKNLGMHEDVIPNLKDTFLKEEGK